MLIYGFIDDSHPPPKPKHPKKTCKYCDSIITIKKNIKHCPNCGAPIKE